MMPTLVVVLAIRPTTIELVSALRSWGFEVGIGTDFVGTGSGARPKIEGGIAGNRNTRVVRDTRIIFVDSEDLASQYQPGLVVELIREVIFAYTRYEEKRILDVSSPEALASSNKGAETRHMAMMISPQTVRVNASLMSNEEMARYIERLAKFVAWREAMIANNISP